MIHGYGATTDDTDAYVDRDGTVRSAQDGAEVLDDARLLLTTYCALPSPESADAIVLWCAATHALPVLPFAPRLSVRSATKRSGKSRVLEVVAALSYQPLKTINATVPAIFRSLGGEHPPTLIFDEVDTIFGSRKVAENNEDLRGLLNAGFERGSPSIRCVGPLQVPTEFPSFAMAALAGIGSLPDTIEDRSVIVHMRRRKSTEVVKPFRLRRDRGQIVKIGGKLGAWLGTEDARARLEGTEPTSDLEDRAADVWESLFMIADLAGGDWPTRARDAAKNLCAEVADDEHETSLPVMLLHDIREVFAPPLITSAETPTETLLAHLKGIDGAPWSDMDLTGHRLAAMLRNFDIRSKHVLGKAKRGYLKRDFADAWERYPKPAKGGEKTPGAKEQAGEASEASGSVHTHSDQGQCPDTCPDAFDAPSKVSGQVSHDSRRSDPLRTVTDTSDDYPAGTRCRVCGRSQQDWVLAERDGRCIPCDQDHRTGRIAVP